MRELPTRERRISIAERNTCGTFGRAGLEGAPKRTIIIVVGDL